MGPNTPGVVIGLSSIIAVCGAVLLWVHRQSAPMDFIERHLGFSPDGGDGSMEVASYNACHDHHPGGVPLGV